MKKTERSLFAVAGDVHGDFKLLKNGLTGALKERGLTEAELSGLFLVGDAEAIRSVEEMGMIHGPSKYRKMGDFSEVMSGELKFETPTYFIGGNHEPWDALDKDGGMAQNRGDWGPGFTFLGRAGNAEISGLKVSFLSAISSPEMREARAAGIAEDRPRNSKRNRTYWTQAEVNQALNAKKRPDIFLAHEWPLGLGCGKDGLQAGSWQLNQIIERQRPSFSFHGHMHFSAEGEIGDTKSYGLSHISNGADAIMIFSKDDDGSLHLL